MRKNAYSLPELIMIMIIIAILGSIAFTVMGNILTNSKIKASEKEMMEIVTAIVGDADQGLLGYVAEVGNIPEKGGSTGAQADFYQLYSIDTASPYNPFTRTGWNGPYIDMRRADVNADSVVGAEEYDVLFDSWGKAYVYDEGSKQITSYGPDGVSGGGDDIVIDIE